MSGGESDAAAAAAAAAAVLVGDKLVSERAQAEEMVPGSRLRVGPAARITGPDQIESDPIRAAQRPICGRLGRHKVRALLCVVMALLRLTRCMCRRLADPLRVSRIRDARGQPPGSVEVPSEWISFVVETQRPTRTTKTTTTTTSTTTTTTAALRAVNIVAASRSGWAALSRLHLVWPFEGRPRRCSTSRRCLGARWQL